MSTKTHSWSGMSIEFSEQLKELENTHHCKGYGFFTMERDSLGTTQKEKKIS